MNANQSLKALRNAEKRLGDSHFLWCQCRSSYEELDKFHIHLNACIQCLRSITFVLQKNKAEIPQFDEWYDVWRNAMKNDRVMSWLVEARNHIEKKGDLEINSKFIVSVLADYSESPQCSFVVPPLSSNSDVLKQVLTQNLPDSVRQNGFYKIERRWISASLPEHELLNALAYSHGVLRYILQDAKKHIEKCIEGNVDIHVAKCRDDRPLCMIDNTWDRSALFSIDTGDRIQISTTESTPISLEELEKHYSFEDSHKLPVNSQNFFEICDAFFERAKLVCTTDGGHCTIVILLSETGPGSIFNLQPKTRSDKWVLWNKVAADVKSLNADRVIAISEVWTAHYDPQFPDRHAIDSPNREEALALDAISFTGEQYSILCSLQRKDGKVLLGKTQYSKESNLNFLMPVRKVWQRKRLGDAFRPYKLNSKDQCPCQSGKKYKSCCKKPVAEQLYNKAEEFAKTGSYRKAERAYRAWLTQYTIWYNEHTVPFAAACPQEAKRWIEVDRNALIEICLSLTQCMLAQGKLKDAPTLLEKCSTIMEDSTYTKRILESAKTLKKDIEAFESNKGECKIFNEGDK